MSEDLASPTYAGALGDGLVRRWSTEADVERVAALMGVALRDAEDELPNRRVMAEARLLTRPDYAFSTADDIALVEDTSVPGRPVVACTWFWRHTWSYAGIPFAVTRPEMVAADPAHRRRGLIRSVFEMIHARGAAEGHLLAAITGIPYFYRQFGYEYVLDLEGSRTVPLSLIPDRSGEDPEPCTLRMAEVDDAGLLKALYDAGRPDSLLWHEAPEQHWEYEIAVWDDPAVREAERTAIGTSGRYWVILGADGRVCGSLWIASRRHGRSLGTREIAFAPDADPPALMPSVLRALRDLGQQVPVTSGNKPCSEIRFDLGRTHVVYDLLGDEVAARVEPPYAWYIRVPDVPAFLRHIAPALDERVSRSAFSGFTGSLKADLYREGLHLRFERGKLAAIEPWQAPIPEEQSTTMGCPPLTFLQLLLGWRSVEELRAVFPDVWFRDDQRLLIDTLFPKRRSQVEPLV